MTAIEFSGLTHTASGAGCAETGTLNNGIFDAVLLFTKASKASEAGQGLWVDH